MMARSTSVAALVCLAAFVAACASSGSGASDGGATSDHPDANSDAASTDAAAEPDAGFRALFNGVDFSGWDRYLGEPSPTEPPLGLDNDPRGVYRIVALDGEPALRISGEVWGALISQEQFCNFHLRAEYEWGSLVWPPLNAVDSGLMFLSTGPLGAVNAGGDALSDPLGSGAFMVSMEYQLAPNDVGTLYNLGPIAFATTAHVASTELPGGWNQLDIVHQGDGATTLLNGQQVTQASGFSLKWPGQAAAALSCGKLQLQSEGAEIFFRRLEVQALP
jgi:hypothetical protein